MMLNFIIITSAIAISILPIIINNINTASVYFSMFMALILSTSIWHGFNYII